jgi:Protein of unknown function (DUF4058)
MSSPFPVIDPYIEAQSSWGDFHPSFVTYCRDSLNELLPEGYVAQLGEQLRLVDVTRREGKRIIPDVAVLGQERKPVSRAARSKPVGGTLTLEPVTIRLPRVEMEVRDVWIEILRLPKKVPVSVIEVLSPTNKTGDGFWDYQLKRRKTISRKVHLIEFDFLLGGHRLPMDRALPPGDYYALVSRAKRRPDCDVYAWTIRDHLPAIPIPLLPPDPDVLLDLGEVFATAYERGRYDRLIDYSKPLTLLRRPADRTWAEGIARRGRR